MSRIGNYPIAIPQGVTVNLTGTRVSIKGPKGHSEIDFQKHVDVKQENGSIVVHRHGDERQDRAYHGLYQRMLRNMVLGVTKGFQRDLELVGVGYRAHMDGKTLVLSVGYSHEVRYAPPEGIQIATPKPTQITVTGIDKQQVGQVAAEIREVRPPEPYKGKGIRYMGEHIRRKVGKAGAK